MAKREPEVIEYGTMEYKRLSAGAELLEATSKNGYLYGVEDVYFDYGQGWLWTTIVAYNPAEPSESILHSWQAINPRQWGEILTADTVDSLAKCVTDIQSDKYFTDR